MDKVKVPITRVGITMRVDVCREGEEKRDSIDQGLFLWVQSMVKCGRIKLFKVKGTENPADLLTKHLTAPIMHKLIELFGFSMRGGRANLTPSA